MAYLFQCAIGPVQDFIASARRSRDLWYGSWLLSELAKAAAKSLADQYGFDKLIFPAPSDYNDLLPDSTFTVPNKVVAEVIDTPDIVADKVKAALDERLQNIWGQVLSTCGPIDDRLANEQLSDLIEYYWVGVPFTGNGDYDSARRLAEAALAARKATRNFGQVVGKPIPKSSLDGARETVIPESAYPSGFQDAERDKKNRNLYRRYGARRAEQLSGVDLLKRRGGRGITVEQKFRSTSHMAALPFLELVRKRRGTGAVRELLEEIRTFLNEEDVDIEDRDGALLYESRLREWVPDESKLKQVKSKLAGILEKYSGRKSEPGTYYALLLADGDNMGAAIEAQISPKSHRSLSQALSSFAVNVVPIVEKHQGTCIYAGGDDVLAYLPLHTVLTCAQELADEFANSMAGFPTSAGITPTLSTGIAVVHHLDPLSDALVLARRTEKAAKQVPGKNALAITISKRSGVDRTIAGPRAVLASRLTEVIGFLRNQEIGKGVAYELQELHRVLGPAAIPAALAQEMKRIVKRKRDLQTRSNIIKEQSDRVSERMSTWIETGAVTVDGLAREMIVATTFADAQDMAEGSVTQSEEAVA